MTNTWSKDAFEKLMRFYAIHGSLNTRDTLVRQGRLPMTTLAILVNDDDYEISEVAQERMSKIEFALHARMKQQRSPSKGKEVLSPEEVKALVHKVNDFATRPAEIVEIVRTHQLYDVDMAVVVGFRLSYMSAWVIYERYSKVNRESAHKLLSALAMNSMCPEDVISKLIHHEIPRVRMSAAWNPSCPRGILEELTTDPDRAVRRVVTDAIERHILEVS